MSAREDAVMRLAQHRGIDNVKQLPALEFLEACQPGFRQRLDRILADRGLEMDGTGTIVEKSV
jgi:hypothetical protein